MGFPGKRGVGVGSRQRKDQQTHKLLAFFWAQEQEVRCRLERKVEANTPQLPFGGQGKGRLWLQEPAGPELGREGSGVGVGRRHQQHHVAEEGVSCLGHNKTQRA